MVNNVLLAFGVSFFGSLFALIVFEVWSMLFFRRVTDREEKS